MATLATATIASLNPLRIVMHGDAVSIPALNQQPYAPAVGAVVRVQVRRSGLLPIVQGALG